MDLLLQRQHRGARGARSTTLTTHDDHLKDTGSVSPGAPNQRADKLAGSGQLAAGGYAEQQPAADPQQAIQVTQRSASGPKLVRRAEGNGEQISGPTAVGAGGYNALELDFRGHHQANAARRYGPYEYYRLVYRYGYDLGVDARYRCAEWTIVKQEARPRWEERNPGTWDEFEQTIRYAWDKARGRC
jgi:hypothetical protein